MADRVIALHGTKAELAMLRTPDGDVEIELVKFHSPPTQGGEPHAPSNTPGLRHLSFLVKGIDAVVAGLQARGTELVGELVRYENSYRLGYVRGPEGIIIELAERSADGSGRPNDPTSAPEADPTRPAPIRSLSIRPLERSSPDWKDEGRWVVWACGVFVTDM